jgi:hypothetical protein
MVRLATNNATKLSGSQRYSGHVKARKYGDFRLRTTPTHASTEPKVGSSNLSGRVKNSPLMLRLRPVTNAVRYGLVGDAFVA